MECGYGCIYSTKPRVYTVCVSVFVSVYYGIYFDGFIISLADHFKSAINNGSTKSTWKKMKSKKNWTFHFIRQNEEHRQVALLKIVECSGLIVPLWHISWAEVKQLAKHFYGSQWSRQTIN